LQARAIALFNAETLRPEVVVADQARADIRVEIDDRGRFPFIGFRLQGFSPVKTRAEPDRDM